MRSYLLTPLPPLPVLLPPPRKSVQGIFADSHRKISPPHIPCSPLMIETSLTFRHTIIFFYLENKLTNNPNFSASLRLPVTNPFLCSPLQQSPQRSGLYSLSTIPLLFFSFKTAPLGLVLPPLHCTHSCQGHQ